MAQNSEWTEVITPQGKWFDLKLRELLRYKDLIAIFVRRDIIAMYKQTVLGPLWFFLSPLFTIVVYTFVFGEIAGMSTDGLPKPLFYLAGVTLWNYFSQCFTKTSQTFVANAGIFGKVYFPRLVAPISVVIANLFKFGIQFLFLILLMCYYIFIRDIDIGPNKYIWLFPFVVLIMGMMALGMGIIISSLTTKYRDLTYFISFGVSLLMFASPVIYPVSAIPDTYRPFLEYNPIAPVIETFRFILLGEGAFALEKLLYSFGFSVVAFLTGTVLFNRIERSFMDTV